MRVLKAITISIIVLAISIFILVVSAEKIKSLAALTNEITSLHQQIYDLTKQNEQQTAEMQKAVEETQEAGNDISKKLLWTLDAVSRQATVLEHSLGNVTIRVPDLPAEFENEFSFLEANLKDKDRWPKNKSEGDVMQKKLVGLIKELPPWVEQDLLPRINLVRWEVQAVSLIGQTNTTDASGFGNLDENISSLLDSEPDGLPNQFADALKTAQKKTASQYEDFQRSEVIRVADEKLKQNESSGELEKIWQQLGELTENASDSEHILALRGQLRNRIIQNQTKSFLETAKANLEKLEKLSDDSLQQMGMARLLESVLNQRLALVIDSDAPVNAAEDCTAFTKSIENKLDAIAEHNIQQAEQKHRDYQRWALTQIQAFNTEFTAAINEKKQEGDFFKTPNYDRIRDAAVSYLLPVSQGQLEPAVSRLYNDAFYEKAWKKLEDRKSLQTEIAEKESQVKKISLSTLPASE